LPSKVTLAFFLEKNSVNRISEELNTYGKIEITMSNFRSVIIANATNVSPMANDPVFPTKIIPLKFNDASTSHMINGPYNRSAYGPEMIMSPIKTVAGHTVSKLIDCIGNYGYKQWNDQKIVVHAKIYGSDERNR